MDPLWLHVRDVLDAFCLKRYPREVGMKLESFFRRNIYVFSADDLTDVCLEKSDRFVSVYSFGGEVREGEPWDRSKAVVDRLFFDFDCGSGEFRENISASLRETKRFVKRLDCEPIVVFSGSKGFHVHVTFEPTSLKNLESIKQLGTAIVEKFSLKHADPVVFEVSRLCRAPGSVNSKTGLTAITIRPKNLLEMRVDDVIRASKKRRMDIPEPTGSDLGKELQRVDAQVEELRKAREEREEETIVYDRREGAFMDASVVGKKRRLQMYVETLLKTGKLTSNPKILEIHSKSEWVRKVGKNIEAYEHLARVYLVLMMIEDGWSDEEIHAVFRHAKDYDAKKTQYYIDYNRKWLAKRRERREEG